MKRKVLMFLFALAVSATAGQAMAGGCGWGGNWGMYYGYSGYTREYIPYFAANPPVYYSYPVPRPYGWSPFAYPPGTMTPELQFEQAPAPVSIQNPFFKPEAKSEGTAASTPVRSQSVAVRISNPYVQQGPTAKLAKVRSAQ